jgi:phospholipid/cholesterol/gamma-HCH transport system substrate-binding protein
MNISAAQKIKTGLFVLVSLLLLVILVTLIGKQKNLFGNTFFAYANFKNISGTKEGNYVRLAGINIGTVESIHIINDTTVRLELSIEKRIQPYIKSDAIASIGSDGLMGDKLVFISPGNNASPVISNGGQLSSSNPVDVDLIMNNLKKISDNAVNLTGGLSDIVEKINSGKGSIGRLLDNDKLAVKMENTIDQASLTVNSIKKNANSVDENMQAAKHNFLLRGFFKKKERKRIKDSIENAKKSPIPELKQK